MSRPIDAALRAAVLDYITRQGVASWPTIAAALKLNGSRVAQMLIHLRREGTLKPAGTEKQTNRIGGGPRVLYDLAERVTEPMELPRRVESAVTRAATRRRARSGGGVKAGPIVIPQFRWGSTRLS